jgi:teichuronic acid biosynthesis glycosyltransferase TuaG
MIDKRKTGYFEMPNIRSSHDMALWCQLLKKGFKAFGLNEILSSYRIVDSSNTAKKWKAAKDVWFVYRTIENLNFMKSAYYFTGYVYNAILKRISN